MTIDYSAATTQSNNIIAASVWTPLIPVFIKIMAIVLVMKLILMVIEFARGFLSPGENILQTNQITGQQRIRPGAVDDFWTSE